MHDFLSRLAARVRGEASCLEPLIGSHCELIGSQHELIGSQHELIGSQHELIGSQDESAAAVFEVPELGTPAGSPGEEVGAREDPPLTPTLFPGADSPPPEPSPLDPLSLPSRPPSRARGRPLPTNSSSRLRPPHSSPAPTRP